MTFDRIKSLYHRASPWLFGLGVLYGLHTAYHVDQSLNAMRQESKLIAPLAECNKDLDRLSDELLWNMREFNDWKSAMNRFGVPVKETDIIGVYEHKIIPLLTKQAQKTADCYVLALKSNEEMEGLDQIIAKERGLHIWLPGYALFD